MKLGILGGGSWGTALAVLWARNHHPVNLWLRNPDDAAHYQTARRNTKYLPHISFPQSLCVTHDLDKALDESDLICLAIPLQAYREFFHLLKDRLRDHQQLLLLSKGIEVNTLKLPSEIVVDVLGESWRDRTFNLSGPSFAKEVAEGKPTTVVLAGQDDEKLRVLQRVLTCPTFRTYRNLDVVGVELCAALKNVIAIASGMSSGLELGHNTIAGLITRGLAEISRLAVAMGGQRETCAGLAGMGDLILTCTGDLSRNLRVGMALADGDDLDTALQKIGMVAEGVHTCRAAQQLAHKMEVDLPITGVIYKILYQGLSPKQALQALMTRSLKAEIESD